MAFKVFGQFDSQIMIVFDQQYAHGQQLTAYVSNSHFAGLLL
jgi:hypothetical protein